MPDPQRRHTMTGPGQELAAQQGPGGERPPITRSPRRRVMAAGRSRAGTSASSTSNPTFMACTCGPPPPAARAGSRRPAGTAPAASQMRAAPDPRILTGWSGASPHVLRFPPRAFLRFPVCPPGSPPSPAFLRFPVVRRPPVRPGRRPGSGSPFGVPPGSLPLGNPHDSAAAGRFRRRWSRAARAKVTSPAATLPFLDLAVIRPAPRAGRGRARWMPLQNRLLRAAAGLSPAGT